MMGMVIPVVPTTADLERHYQELHEQRRRLEEVLERTDRMLAGLKRGIDEMRVAGAGGNVVGGGHSPSTHEGNAPMSGGGGASSSVPLPRQSPGEKERREPVWPVIPHEHDAGN